MQRGCCDVALVKLTKIYPPPGASSNYSRADDSSEALVKLPRAVGTEEAAGSWIRPPDEIRRLGTGEAASIEGFSALGVSISRLQEPDKRNTGTRKKSLCPAISL